MKKRQILVLAFIAVLALSLLVACKPTVYTVSFESNGGSTVEAQLVEKGGRVTKPTDPIKSGFNFDNWYTADGQVWHFDADTVQGDMTLYARYTVAEYETYTVSFNSNGGSSVASQTVTEGNAASKPTDPTKTAFIFKGWYADEGLTTAYDFSAPVTGNITLHAKWEFDTSYIVLEIDYGEHGGVVEAYSKPNSAFSFVPYLVQDGNQVSVSFQGNDGTSYLFGKTYKFGAAQRFTAVFEQTDCLLSWSENNLGWQIEGAVSGATEIDVPATLHGYAVRTVADRAFANTAITSLKLPDSIVKVGDAILAGCASLQSLSLPYVGDTISTQYGKTTILGWYFGAEAYQGSTETTVYYGVDANSGSSRTAGQRTTAYYPDSLETLEIRGGTIHCFVAEFMPARHLVLSNVTTVKPYAFYHSMIEDVTFEGDKLEEIAQFSFTETQLKSLSLPDGLWIVGRCAFGENHSLTEVTMTDSVSAIDGEVFASCENLSSVRLSESITEISYNMFINCRALKNIELPSGALLIGPQAFEGTGIEQIELPETLISIGTRAFCFSALTSITIPAEVYSLGESIFWYCSKLSSVTFLGDKITFLPAETFKTTASLKHIDIPSSVTAIAKEAFYESGLTEITLHDGITALGTAVFYGSTSLTKVTFEGDCQITRLPDSTFEKCTALTDIEIPASVTTFGSKVFQSCSSLRLLIIPSNVTTIEGPCFVGATYIRICSPEASKPEGWSDNWNSSELPCIFVGRDFQVSGDFLYVVEGSGARIIAHFTGESDVVIPGEIEGNTVVEIGESSFEYDYSMITLVIENGVSTISPRAFKDCRFVKSVTLPESLTTIEEEAFYGCWALGKMNLPESLNTIGSRAFQNCSSAIFYTTLSSAPSGWTAKNALSGLTVIYNTSSDDIKVHGIFNYVDMDDHIKILRVAKGEYEGVIVIPREIDGKLVTELGASAFNNVETYAIYIPSTVTIFGKECFSARRLNLAFEAASKPEGLTSGSFSGTYYDLATMRYSCTEPVLDEATGFWYFTTAENKAVVVGLDGVHLSIAIPTTLGGCEVDTIGTGAFYYNKNFVSMIIPSTVKYAGYWAFYNTNAALKVYCNASDTSAFHANWNSGASAQFYYNVEVKTTDEFEYIVVDGNVIITHYIGNSKIVTIPAMIDGKPVTEIGVRAFAVDPEVLISPSVGVYVVKFEEGSNLTTIGTYAFYNCQNLIKVYYIPKSVTTIGNNAFTTYANKRIGYILMVFEGNVVGKIGNYLKGTYYCYDGSYLEQDGFAEWVEAYGPPEIFE